jgi:hypothetical protein
MRNPNLRRGDAQTEFAILMMAAEMERRIGSPWRYTPEEASKVAGAMLEMLEMYRRADWSVN